MLSSIQFDSYDFSHLFIFGMNLLLELGVRRIKLSRRVSKLNTFCLTSKSESA